MDEDRGGVIRRNIVRDEKTDLCEDLDIDMDSKEFRLTLMEETLIIGIKDRDGYISFWNDKISSGLRGCILLELGLRDRIGLEPSGVHQRALLSRAIIVKKGVPTGDALMDEALKHIKENKPGNIKQWLEYLSGDTWNPFKFCLQMHNVRERLAKSLVDKGICCVEKQNFVVFDMITHPLMNSSVKERLIHRIQDVILNRWTSNVHKIDKRSFGLIMLAHCSGVLDTALAQLCDRDYDIAKGRVDGVMDFDFFIEASREGACEILWAILAALTH